MKCFIFFAFYNALDLNNQKILCLPSIFQFERTVHNLNHPKRVPNNGIHKRSTAPEAFSIYTLEYTIVVYYSLFRALSVCLILGPVHRGMKEYLCWILGLCPRDSI